MINDIEKWRVEIDLAEELRKKEFGDYTGKDILLAGENIEYFEKGLHLLNTSLPQDFVTTLNIIHAIVKNVVPSLWYQNPYIMVTPKKAESQDTAPIVGHTLNHYYKHCDFDGINRKIVWDAYVLGHGYYKIGYATKFGMDIADEKKKKTFIQKALDYISDKKEDEDKPVEMNLKIKSENPFITYVSPFNFVKDPRALTLEESQWVGQRFKKTLKSLKQNPKYKNVNKLKGSEPDIPYDALRFVSESELDDYKTVDIYEIHYRSDDKYYLLILAKDGDRSEALYHAESVYEMSGWQFGELSFHKHGHKYFTKSDISKIKLLQDRLTSTIDVILEQVDKFSPKLAYNDTEVTEEGKAALQSGGVGALVKTSRNPSDVFKELNFTQFKADLKVLIDQIIDIITIQTGITRTQLTGMATGNSATEATIAQGGQTLRIADMNEAVRKFANEQSKKLWEICRQFVELEKLELINGVNGVDQTTGFPRYNWVTVDPTTADQMRYGDYDFEIEVGSSEKPDLAVVRKQFENLFSILSRSDVILLMQQQGDKVVISELLRMYLNLFPSAVKDIGKVIQKINAETQGLIQSEQGATTQGSNFNQLEGQMAQQIPNLNNILSEAGNNT